MKRILSLLLVAFILSSACITANAEPYIELSDDKTYLYIEGAEKIPDLSEYTKLEEIYFSDCVIDVRMLQLVDEKIKQITFNDCDFKTNNLLVPYNVNEITFIGTVVDDMSFAESLSKLKKMTISECELDNLNMFTEDVNITGLTIDRCTVVSLEGVEKLSELETLFIDYTDIEKINGVEALPNLEYLSLTGSSVEDVSLLKDTKLTYLNVDDCVRLKSLDVVTKMTELECLFADNCEMAASEKLITYLKKSEVSSNLDENSLKIKSKVKKIAKSLNKKGLSDEEIVGTVVKYVCDHMTYDFDVDYDDKLGYEYDDNRLKYALEGKGSCANYTTFTTALLRECGIDCYEVDGFYHIWNLVKVDGYCYWLDTTWIDTDGTEKLSDSPWFMAGPEFVANHQYDSLPTSVYLNKNSFNGTYSCDKEFYLGEAKKENASSEKKEDATEDETKSEAESETKTEAEIEAEIKTVTETEKIKEESANKIVDFFSETVTPDNNTTIGKIIICICSALALICCGFFIYWRRRSY